jgi:hypothetical protein
MLRDVVAMAIGDIDGVRAAARCVPLSELTGRQKALGPLAHGETKVTPHSLPRARQWGVKM